MFDFYQTFRGVNTDFFQNFTDIFLISPTSDPSDFLLKRAMRTVDTNLVLRFPPPVKLTPQYNWNIVESGIQHHNHNPLIDILERETFSWPDVGNNELMIQMFLFIIEFLR